MFQDSFFAPDSRSDSLGNSEFASLTFANPRPAPARHGNGNGHDAAASPSGRNGAGSGADAPPAEDDDETGGVVVESPSSLASRSHH